LLRLLAATRLLEAHRPQIPTPSCLHRRNPPQHHRATEVSTAACRPTSLLCSHPRYHARRVQLASLVPLVMTSTHLGRRRTVGERDTGRTGCAVTAPGGCIARRGICHVGCFSLMGQGNSAQPWATLSPCTVGWFLILFEFV
jgi:hypothetical protein